MEDRISRMAKSHCRLSGDELCYQQSYFICLNCRLIQLPPLCRPSASGNTRQTNEMDSLSNSFRGTGRTSRDFNPSGSWKGERTADLHKLSQCNKGLDRVTQQRRSNKPKSLMAEQDKLQQTDSYRRLPKPEATRVRYGHLLHDKQSRVKMKIHSAKPPNYGNQSRRGDRVFLLDERRNISLQPDSDLICKYIDMDRDKLKDRKRQITHEQAENVKFEEHKIQTDDTERNCFLKDDGILSSPKIQRRQMPKSVGFYIPNAGDETDTAVTAPGSRRDHFCRTHPRSRYLIHIHNGRGLVKQSGHHLDPLENVCRLRKREELNDYLTVKVNLQPFRQTKGHPNSATPTGSEPPKTVHSSGEKCQPTKKSKMRAVKDAVVQTTTVTGRTMGGVINGGPRLGDNSEEKDPCAKDRAPDSEETPYIVPQKTKFKEEAGNVSCARGRDLQNVLEEASPNPSETQRSTAFSEQESLISEVNHKGEISAERREEHAEYRDPEIPSAAEELGESKDNAPSLGGRERGASSLKAGGVSAEKGNISPENNAAGDTNTEGQPSSTRDNKMAARLQANREGNELDRSYRTDDSAAQNTIDAAVDKGADNEDPITAGPCTDCLTEKTMRDAEGRGEHRVPQIEHHVNGDYREDTLHGDTLYGDTLYGGTLSAEQRSGGSLGNEEALVGLDLEVRSNERVQKGYLLDGAQRDGGALVKEGDESHESHKENEIETGTENQGGLKSQENNGSRSRQPLTTRANDSPSHTQRNEQSNSNNNHSSSEASGKARKKRLSLSENSKVIIVVESRSQKIDIQKYLSERSSKHPIWQDTNSSRNEPDGASSDSQRKKICLILPEKPDGRETKRANKKIK